MEIQEQRTWRIDTARQAVDGIVQPFINSILLLVAIRFFAVGDFWKGVIAASNFIGLLLSSPLTAVLNRSRIPRRLVLAVLTAAASAAMFTAALMPGGIPYTIAAACASAAVYMRQPFFTDLYKEFYPGKNRARRISPGLRVHLLISVGCGVFYGILLEGDIGRWRLLLAAAALALLGCVVPLLRLPESEPRPREESWLHAMALPFRRPVFLYVQAAWMVMGFGSLCTLPLRAVYLAENERGLGLGTSVVTLVLVVIPMAVSFIFNPLWARIYHRTGFAPMRMVISSIFGISIPLFFLTESLPVIILSTVLFGFAAAGSPFIWQLWVTRIAGASEVRIYQSAHAFLAGLRGLFAPFVGFAVLGSLSFRQMGFLSGGLALFSAAMMIPLLRGARQL